MSEIPTRLTDEEVKSRLTSYKDPAVTDELHEFGRLMVDQVVDRFKSLDAKATAIAAYSVGLVTLLVSTYSAWSRITPSWVSFAPVASGLFALAAAAVAITAVWLKRLAGFSQDEWMKAECLDDAEKLRRYHVLAMCGVHRSYQKWCQKKATRIAIAEGLLLASGIVLVFALVSSVSMS